MPQLEAVAQSKEDRLRSLLKNIWLLISKVTVQVRATMIALKHLQTFNTKSYWEGRNNLESNNGNEEETICLVFSLLFPWGSN